MAQKKVGGRNALDDLVMIDKVEEGKILEALKNRYLADSIYTNIGPVLIAINPFKMIKPLYTDAKIREYRGKKYFEMPPHVYALADETYSNMISYRENQCVIITGESGSGKTETSKIFMQYIAGVSGKGSEVQKVKEKMLGSNPILEAFGNAKTVNNNNSSRFGKYMEIVFDLGGDPQGGRVTNYLLEKARVVGPGQNERNFHAFYQLCAGASPQDKQNFAIESVDYFYYLSQTGCYTVDGIDDLADYQEQQAAMDTLGFSPQEKQEISRVLAVVLWLGNIAFGEDGQEKAFVKDPEVLNIAAGLLQVQPTALTAALCNRKIQTGTGGRTEVFVKPNNQANSDFSRDTLSKALYSKMFDWVVAKINLTLEKPGFVGIQIGVLDIYGFEIFQYNSFEQLCINFVNERLQQIFIELTLKAEQEEYVREGIPWKEIKYINNKPLCDLIELKPGVLSICDDCCNTAKTDAMFCQDLSRYFGGNSNIFVGSQDFTIKHYAGSVRYESANFLTKNKDTLFDDLIEVMQTSPCSFVKLMGWTDLVVTAGQKQRPPTVGAQFKTQVKRLMDTLMACTPHYIRCIKPNMQKTPNTWDNDNIGRQVKYLGLLENVRVRRAGYAHRTDFQRFVNRYKLLCDQIWNGQVNGPPQQLVGVLCNALGWTVGKEYVLGKTKLFIQDATVLFHLEDLLDRKINDAVVEVQKAWRSYKQKRYYLQSRADSYDLVNGKKERRRASVSREYQGDYVDFAYNKTVAVVLQAAGPKERVVFADRCKVAALRGKASFFSSLLSKQAGPAHDPRFILLSDKALYCFSFIIDPQDAKVKTKLYFRVTVDQIQSIVVSPYADNFFVLHFTQGAGPLDILLSCRRKTEFLGLIQGMAKSSGRNLSILFQDTDQILINPKKNHILGVKWVKDEAAPTGDELLVPIKRGVEIHVSSGLTGSQVPVPPRPQTLDPMASGRPMLKALYDCPGNGVDEIPFKAGDMIMMMSDAKDGWYEGSVNGKSGFIPASYVEKIVKGKGGGAAFPGLNPAPSNAKKMAWKELKTDKGEVYYWNEDTNESAWEKPAEMLAAAGPPKKTCEFAGCSNNPFGPNKFCVSHMNSAKPAAGPPQRAQAQPKKSDWSKVKDESTNDYYYYNERTGASQWDAPPGFMG